MKKMLASHGFQKIAYPCGVVLIVGAIALCVVESFRISEMRDTAISMAKELPELRSSNSILKGNIDSERLYGQVGKAALEEQAAAYVLPVTLDQERIRRLFQRIVDAVSETNPITIDRFTFGGSTQSGALVFIPSEMVLSGSEQGVSDFIGILRWSGTFTVHDIVRGQAETFLKRIQAEQPLALPAAEEFLRMDLLAYASRPDQAEEDAFQDLPSNVATDVKQLLLEAGLADVRSSLKTIAPLLRSQQAWPLPLLSIEQLSFEAGKGTVRLTFFTQPTPAK